METILVGCSIICAVAVLPQLFRETREGLRELKRRWRERDRGDIGN
jgi:hypothetical protein